MHNLTIREITSGMPIRAAVVCGVQAWLRQSQGLSILAVLLPAWKAGELSGSDPGWAPTFSSQEKG